MSPRDDHYSYLGLSPAASSEEITAACERLLKQAAAVANVDLERSQAIKERVRQIRGDLLSGEERRMTYDRRLIFEQPTMPVTAQWDEQRTREMAAPRPGWRREAPTPPPGKRGNRARAGLLLVAVLLLIGLAAGGGYAVAKGALFSSSTPVAAPAPGPTATPKLPAATTPPVPTAQPTTPQSTPPTNIATAPVIAPTPASSDTVDTLVAAVNAYRGARAAAFGESHDASQVDATSTGVARQSIYWIMRDRTCSGNQSLERTGSYIVYQPLSIKVDSYNFNSSESATVTEDQHVLLTVYNDDGSVHNHQDNSYTVTYSLVNSGGTWLVSDYQFPSGSGAQTDASC